MTPEQLYRDTSDVGLAQVLFAVTIWRNNLGGTLGTQRQCSAGVTYC